MVIRQGDLVWVSFPPPRGSEPAGRRPAIVVQGDAFNSSRINTIVVAAVTSNLRMEAMPGNVRLAKGEAGISKPSVINVSQLHSIDRSFIRARIGTITNERIEEVKTGLGLVLGL
jgi:mRNA interferase MazF